LLFVLELLLNNLKIELQNPLPGVDAQYVMAPASRPRIDLSSLEIGQYKQSAILILFCIDDKNNLFIPLIERVPYIGAHSAQISFPGGKYEDGDIDLKTTAIRECFEEIGLRDEIEIMGKLTPLYIPVSGFLVEPYIGFCKIVDPPMLPHEREVKNILQLPLNNLLDEKLIVQGTVEVEGTKIKTPYFLVEGHKVWGATAMILSELKSILTRL
jgi:8-oxo-dGTP pyrophosphatase MutT (NUDIX family)